MTQAVSCDTTSNKMNYVNHLCSDLTRRTTGLSFPVKSWFREHNGTSTTASEGLHCCGHSLNTNFLIFHLITSRLVPFMSLQI